MTDTTLDPLDQLEPSGTEHVVDRTRGWFGRHAFPLFLGLLLVLFALVVFWPRMVITIHSGEEGALWKRFSGTQIDTIYYEGTHLIYPWDVMYVYDVRIAKADYSVPVLSTDGLEINVDVTIRYRPVAKTVPKLHQQVGPDYLQRIIIPEVVTAVREVMGRYRPEQLYTLRTVEMQNQILGRAAANVQDRYLVLDDVLIRRITLPDAVQAAIQRKLTQEQEALEYVFRQEKEQREATRKETEAQGIARYQQIIAQSLTPTFLQWKGIEATLKLAESPNSKIVIVGSGQNGMPLILNPDQK